MRISDWSSDVCSSDLPRLADEGRRQGVRQIDADLQRITARHRADHIAEVIVWIFKRRGHRSGRRSEEHTSELQSLMRISYAVFCLKKKKHDIELYTIITIYHTR